MHQIPHIQLGKRAVQAQQVAAHAGQRQVLWKSLEFVTMPSVLRSCHTDDQPDCAVRICHIPRGAVRLCRSRLPHFHTTGQTVLVMSATLPDAHCFAVRYACTPGS
eukprot:358644-Chlamydomonas_euryale.AAC.8